jgi:catechol 2,3-dioxygenase-like lactoylglutathione lyase family enzyme
MLHGVWHFSFTVADLDRSVDFYTRLLGFEHIHSQEQSGGYTSRLVGYPDAHLRIAQLAIPGRTPGHSTHDLELVQYLNPAGTRQDPEIRHPGAAHLALTVDGIHPPRECGSSPHPTPSPPASTKTAGPATSKTPTGSSWNSYNHRPTGWHQRKGNSNDRRRDRCTVRALFQRW